MLNNDVCKVSLEEVSEAFYVVFYQMLMIDFSFLLLGCGLGFFLAYMKYKD